MVENVSSSAVAVDLFVNVLAGVMLAVLLAGTGVGVLTGVDANAFAVVTALIFSVSTPVEDISLCAAFDCGSRALLGCAHVLQA